MIPAKRDQKKITRYAFWGAAIFGFAGFVAGIVICLYYRLPIPPLFITELGLLLGGCLGALCATTGTERRVLPSLAALVGAAALCLGMELDGWNTALAVAGITALTWCLSEPSDEPPEGWRNV